MGHTKGPVVSKEGFKVGTYESSTEIIGSDGKYKLVGGIDVSMLDGEIAATDVADGAVKASKLGLAVINKTGGKLDADSLVAVVELDGTAKKPEIVLADAEEAGHEDVWVLTADIENDAEGVVRKSALSGDVDTDAPSVGDPVYLATTAGEFTHIAPIGADARVHPVGLVTKSDNTEGQILWNIGPVRKVGSNEIQTNAITATQIANDTITATQIANGTITATQIAGDTITAAEIDGNTITAAEIANDTITATQIDSDTITAAEIAADTITATELTEGSVWTHLVGYTTGFGKNYDKTHNTDDELVANPTGDKTALVIVTVTEAFSDGGDAQPVFKIGTDNAGSSESIMSTTQMVDAALGTWYVWTGTISDSGGDIINVNGTEYSGGGTGAISVLALIKDAP